MVRRKEKTAAPLRWA